MTPRVTAGANSDIADLVAFFEAQRTGAGARFTADVDAFIQRVIAQPRLYGSVPRPPRAREIRRGVTTVFSAVIVYEVTPAEIVIWSVTHGHAKRQPWRRRLGPNP